MAHPSMIFSGSVGKSTLQPILGAMFKIILDYKTNCIKECKASEDRTHCVSCLRTIDEIIKTGRDQKRCG